MASIESVVRFKNTSLFTQQRRLRHLRSIAARNLSWRKKPQSDVGELQAYFTLHKDKKSKALYTSEKITGSLNPSWRSFVLEMLGDEGDLTATSLVVRIWQRQESSSNFKVCVEWEVDLSGLVYLGDRLQAEGIHHRTNTVIFGMFDGFYSAPVESPQKNTKPASPASESFLTVDQAWVRDSYSAHTLARIQTILRAIKQTSVSVRKVRRNIEEKLSYSERLQNKKSEREMRIVKVNMMRADLEWRTMQLQSEKETYETLQATNCQRDVALKNRFETLHKDKGRLHEKKKSYFDVREELIKTGAQLVMRRKQLISELISIYPIRELPDGGYTISAVKLPNSEDFAGHDDTMVAVSLGNTCHLLQMISQFLDIPLRYPMEHRGSRSQITDHIIDKLSDKERDFPLYGKGKEKFQFNYGVYLLNKNIAQVRYYCGLATADLRLTLPNLKSLLELRLGVKFESGNSLLPGQHLIPPNLGGPQKMTSPSFGQPPKTQQPEPSTDDTDSVSQPPNENSEFEEVLKESKQREMKVTNGPSMAEPEPKTSPETESSQPLESKEIVLEEVFEALPEEIFEAEVPVTDVCLTDGKKNDSDAVEKNPKDSESGSSSVTLKDEATFKFSESIKHPSVKSSDDLNKQRLLGSAANYDEVDMSSEESANITYGSKFKLWPRDAPVQVVDKMPNRYSGAGENADEDNGSAVSASLPEANRNNSIGRTRELLSSSSEYNAQDEGGVTWDNESSIEQDSCNCTNEANTDCEDQTTSDSRQSEIQKRTDALWNNYPTSFKPPAGTQSPSAVKELPDSSIGVDNTHLTCTEGSS